ncbi:MAG: histidine phosphatase family protein [Saprospiraceae bacterium]|nr:histidine phosphatase family protein [Saprospiraceae bacterium]
MKKVYFIRHAKSSWADARLPDMDRPLNDRGLRDAPFMGKLLKGRGISPDRFISSPAKRARLTAEFIAREMDYPVVDIEFDRRIYEAHPEDLLDVVRELPNHYKTVFLFGHNPSFTSLANMFAREPIDNVPTCGVFRLDSSIDDWADFSEDNTALVSFDYPKQYFK